MRAFLAGLVVLSFACGSQPSGSGAGGGEGASGGGSSSSGGGAASGGGSGSSGGGAASGGGSGSSGGGAGTGGGSGSSGGGAASGGGSGSSGGGAATGGGAGSTGGGTGASGGGSAGGGAGGSGGGDPFSTDRGLFFGASRCSGSGFTLCEDFESGTINSNTWTVSGGNAVAVGTADHARGTHALHITRTGNGNAYIKETKTFPAPNNSYFGRAFVKFISLPAAPMGYAHWTIIAASGTQVAGEIRVSGQRPTNPASKQLYGVGTDNRVQDAGTGDWTTSDNDPTGNPRAVPLNEWMCIEWQHDGMNNETRFWWDGTEHPSLHTTPTKHGGNANPFILPQFTNVWLGWAEYQASTQVFELWMDEIAINSTRIGCVR